MKYQPGDKILVLLTDEEGTIVEIMNEKMALIEVNGVKFPIYTDQIDFPYFKMFSEKRKAEKKKIFIDNVQKEKSTPKQKEGNGVMLSFMPVYDKDIFDDDIVEKFKLYLVNQNETAYTFTYNLLIGGETDFHLKNTIEPLSDFYLHDVKFEDLSDSPRFEFEFALKEPDKKKAPYYESSLKLKAKQLFKKIEEIQLKNEPAFSYLLMENYPDKVDETKDVFSGMVSMFHTQSDYLLNSGQLAQDKRDMYINELFGALKGVSRGERSTHRILSALDED